MERPLPTIRGTSNSLLGVSMFVGAIVGCSYVRDTWLPEFAAPVVLGFAAWYLTIVLVVRRMEPGQCRILAATSASMTLAMLCTGPLSDFVGIAARWWLRPLVAGLVAGSSALAMRAIMARADATRAADGTGTAHA